MNTDWLLANLGDVTTILTGFPFKSAIYTEAEEGVALLRGDNVVQGRLRWDGVKKWPTQYVGEVSTFLLKVGDVVLAMDRPWIEAGLKYACINESDLPCLLVQRVARLRATNQMHQGFLRYVIGSAGFTDHILSVQTGTTIPHISGDQIRSFQFLLPPIKEQKAITVVLSALDDKIELNRRMNETLENMARALFQSWFVDFDPVRARVEGRQPFGMNAETAALFPCAFAGSPLSEIPHGWSVLPLDEIARFLNGLALQKFPANGVSHLPVIKIAELRRGVTSSSDKASEDIPVEYIINNGDFLFSWSGSLEAVIWTGGPGALNQHLFKVTSDRYPQWFVYQWVKEHLPTFRQIAASKATTMGHIQRHHLREAQVLVPPPDLLDAMTHIMAPLLDKVICNSIEGQTLVALRDMLLPKLMSGEVRGCDAEKIVEDTGAL